MLISVVGNEVDVTYKLKLTAEDKFEHSCSIEFSVKIVHDKTAIEPIENVKVSFPKEKMVSFRTHGEGLQKFSISMEDGSPLPSELSISIQPNSKYVKPIINQGKVLVISPTTDKIEGVFKVKLTVTDEKDFSAAANFQVEIFKKGMRE